jgi:hypothetical protein
MTDEQILERLKSGEVANYAVHGYNLNVVNFIADLEERGLVQARDASSSQETRREVWWVGPADHMEE